MKMPTRGAILEAEVEEGVDPEAAAAAAAADCTADKCGHVAKLAGLAMLCIPSLLKAREHL